MLPIFNFVPRNKQQTNTYNLFFRQLEAANRFFKRGCKSCIKYEALDLIFLEFSRKFSDNSLARMFSPPTQRHDRYIQQFGFFFNSSQSHLKISDTETCKEGKNKAKKEQREKANKRVQECACIEEPVVLRQQHTTAPSSDHQEYRTQRGSSHAHSIV